MPYIVVLPPAVKRQIVGLGLPDTVFVEVHLRVAALRDRPADSLVRVTSPFEGMGLWVEMIDPANRLCVHRFLFPVVYATDEEHLIVELPIYSRRIG